MDDPPEISDIELQVLRLENQMDEMKILCLEWLQEQREEKQACKSEDISSKGRKNELEMDIKIDIEMGECNHSINHTPFCVEVKVDIKHM